MLDPSETASVSKLILADPSKLVPFMVLAVAKVAAVLAAIPNPSISDLLGPTNVKTPLLLL